MEFLLAILTTYSSCNTEIQLVDIYKNKQECIKRAEEYNIFAQKNIPKTKMICYEIKEVEQ